MSIWLSQHHAALLLALRRLAGAPFNTLLSLLAIGIALALPLGGLVAFSSVQQLAQGTGTVPQLSLFMQLDASRAEALAMEEKLARTPGILSVKFLPREETLQQMRRSEGLGDVIDILPRNPFPDAFIVTPASADPDAMEKLAHEFGQWALVEHVQIDSDWVRRLDAMLRVARVGLVILSLLLGVGLVAITFNTIRLQVLTLRDELDVSRLLGATDAFICRPFLYFGSFQGLLGGVVAWLIVAAATLALHPPMAELSTLYGLNLVASPPDAAITAASLLGSATLGWLGAALSLRFYLRASSTMR